MSSCANESKGLESSQPNTSLFDMPVPFHAFLYAKREVNIIYSFQKEKNNIKCFESCDLEALIVLCSQGQGLYSKLQRQTTTWINIIKVIQLKGKKNYTKNLETKYLLVSAVKKV